MARDEQREFELKPLSKDGIEAAMEKMQRYRLLNEPENAESICRDVLRADPDHAEARIALLLCITDQFGHDLQRRWTQAMEIAETLDEEYEQPYYRGILCERRAKAHFRRRSPQSGNLTYGWLRKAMDWFEKAAANSPPGDDAALLRWNTCARLIMKHPDIRPVPTEQRGPALQE